MTFIIAIDGPAAAGRALCHARSPRPMAFIIWIAASPIGQRPRRCWMRDYRLMTRQWPRKLPRYRSGWSRSRYPFAAPYRCGCVEIRCHAKRQACAGGSAGVFSEREPGTVIDGRDIEPSSAPMRRSSSMSRHRRKCGRAAAMKRSSPMAALPITKPFLMMSESAMNAIWACGKPVETG